MTIARAIRILLALICIAVVGWSFYDVAKRFVERRLSLRDRPIALTVLHWGNPAEDFIVKTLTDEFQRTHKNVQINRVNAGSDFRNKIKTMMAAEMPPDVFYLPPDYLPELATMGQLAPIDEQFAQDPPDWDTSAYPTPQAWRDDFYPFLLNAFRYDVVKGAVGSGKLYALPKDFTPVVFYANTDLLDRAGIDWRSIQKTGWNWARFEKEMDRVRALNGKPEFAGRDIFGTVFNSWGDIIRALTWTYGGEFFAPPVDGKPDFRNVTLDQPPAQRALKMLQRMRLETHTAFNASGIAKDGGQEFINGNIGTSGPTGVWMVPTYKTITKFHWDILPLPREREDAPQIAFYTGWTMSSHSEHPKEAFELIRFLCSKRGQIMQGRMNLAIPCLRSVAKSDDFLNPPPPDDPNEKPIPRYASKLWLDSVSRIQLQQLPRQAEWDRDLTENANRAIQTGQRTTEQAADDVKKAWLADLDSPLQRQQWPKMPWTSIVSIAAAVIATVLVLLWWKVRAEKIGPLDRAQQRAGFAFITPWLIGFLCLTLGPMIASLLLGFSRWTGLNGLREAEYVGTGNYQQLFSHDSTFFQSLKVTFYFVVLGVPVSQVASLAVAMLMNLKIRGIAIFRTIYFVPSVVSGVAMAVLWLHLFNNNYGLINQLLRPVAHLFGTIPPNWFGVDTTANPPVNDAARWAIPAFVIMGLWGVGSGMIIYLAGLKGIPVSMYEAATIDGAGAARKFWNVTLPMLSPLIFYNLVMGIIGSFQVFTQAYVMTGPGPDNATLFYVLNLYRQAFEFHNMGYASAMAWVLFIIVLILTALVFRGSRKLIYYEGLKA